MLNYFTVAMLYSTAVLIRVSLHRTYLFVRAVSLAIFSHYHKTNIYLSAICLGVLLTNTRVYAQQKTPTKQPNIKSATTQQNTSPAAPLPAKKVEEALRLLLQATAPAQDSAQSSSRRRFRPTEIEGLVLDQTVSKIGHDFYDVFYTRWEPPANLGDFTVVIREKPARGGFGSLISVEVNEAELLELPLQPRYDVIEEAALYSVEVAVGYLINAQNISQQLERSLDNPGTEVF